MGSGTDADVYVARGIDGHCVLLDGRTRLAGAHEGPARIRAENPFSHTQRDSLAFESGVTCVDGGGGPRPILQRRCLQRTLCERVMDEGGDLI